MAEMTGDHLDPNSVAEYVDGCSTGEERERVEAHLSECSECCREVAAVRETLRTARSGNPWRFAGPALAAAAVVAGLLLVQPWSEAPGPPGGSPDVLERAAPDARPLAVQIVEPAEGGQVDPKSPVLRWRSAGPGARYQITLTTAAGDSVWAAFTTDTIAAVPAGVGLEPDREYLWYVDALLPNGETASSGISQFRTTTP